ncbi:MAG: hypothetical protein ACE5HO_15415 [bacterium]
MDSSAKERIAKICDELGEEMDSPSCKALRAYVQECPDCAAFVDSVKKTITLYKSYTSKLSRQSEQKLFKVLNLR